MAFSEAKGMISRDWFNADADIERMVQCSAGTLMLDTLRMGDYPKWHDGICVSLNVLSKFCMHFVSRPFEAAW